MESTWSGACQGFVPPATSPALAENQLEVRCLIYTARWPGAQKLHVFCCEHLLLDLLHSSTQVFDFFFSKENHCWFY